MDRLIAVCNDGLQYPLTLSPTHYPEYVLLLLLQQLNLNQHRLFSTEEKSELTFRDLDNDGESKLATFVICRQIIAGVLTKSVPLLLQTTRLQSFRIAHADEGDLASFLEKQHQ